MSQILGKWKFESGEGWDEYMKGLNVNFALRKLGGLAKPQEEWRVDEEGFWYLDITTAIRNVHLKFKLGQTFDEKTADGRDVKSTFETEGDCKIIHVQKGEPADSTITRELEGDNNMKVTFEVAGKPEAKCVRRFSRITE